VVFWWDRLKSNADAISTSWEDNDAVKSSYDEHEERYGKLGCHRRTSHMRMNLVVNCQLSSYQSLLDEWLTRMSSQPHRLWLTSNSPKPQEILVWSQQLNWYPEFEVDGEEIME
jgi:hypothetical protein